MAQRLVPEAWKDAAGWAGSQKRSIYHVFFSLLPMVQEAHRIGDNDLLLRGYAFAEWCARHPARELWNAAGVAFYEHLFDAGARPDDIVPWLTAKTYADVKGLFAFRLGDEFASKIELAMQRRRQDHASALASLISEAV